LIRPWLSYCTTRRLAAMTAGYRCASFNPSDRLQSVADWSPSGPRHARPDGRNPPLRAATSKLRPISACRRSTSGMGATVLHVERAVRSGGLRPSARAMRGPDGLQSALLATCQRRARDHPLTRPLLLQEPILIIGNDTSEKCQCGLSEEVPTAQSSSVAT